MGDLAELAVRITHLEMTAAPTRRPSVPSGMRLALMRADPVPPAFYRFLYEQVGKPHHWLSRRNLDDAALAAVLAGPVEVTVFYLDGAPGGYFELNLAHLPGWVEITHFGLMPHAQGRGLSRWLLGEAISAAFAHKPASVILQTNTLDHPRALSLYQRAGFSPVGWQETTVQAWT